MHLLVVEDDARLRRLLSRLLGVDRHVVEEAPDGRTALELARMADGLDAIILDIGLPDRSGLEVARELRAHGSSVPILMLTARDAIDDRVEGLDAGADDYLPKPFSLRELMARVRALLRRRGSDDGELEPLSYSDLTLDPVGYVVRRGARELTLTRTEFRLLELFLRHPRQVLTRSVIFERIWGYDFGSSSNSLGVYMGYLRRKTQEGGEPCLLQTVRGVGYVLREQ
jgi:two-component system, OmpR family, response regulator MprA